MSTTDLSHPGAVTNRLEEIERDLETRQASFESAARNWYRAKRDKEKARAMVFLSSEGTVAERNAKADQATALDGRNEEAEYYAIKAVVDVLQTRATIGMALLKVQVRA